jgi:hypothetical protein
MFHQIFAASFQPLCCGALWALGALPGHARLRPRLRRFSFSISLATSFAASGLRSLRGLRISGHYVGWRSLRLLFWQAICRPVCENFGHIVNAIVQPYDMFLVEIVRNPLTKLGDMVAKSAVFHAHFLGEIGDPSAPF